MIISREDKYKRPVPKSFKKLTLATVLSDKLITKIKIAEIVKAAPALIATKMLNPKPIKWTMIKRGLFKPPLEITNSRAKRQIIKIKI